MPRKETPLKNFLIWFRFNNAIGCGGTTQLQLLVGKPTHEITIGANLFYNFEGSQGIVLPLTSVPEHMFQKRRVNI